MGQNITIPTSGTQCIGAYMAEPGSKPKGGLVVIQEIYGLNAHMRSMVDRFAKLGYTAIAPAFFDHLETGVELDYDRTGTNKGKQLVTELGLERAIQDVASAAEAIASAGRIGTVGYCWGGTVAYLSATRLGLPAVSYYGGRNTQHVDETARAPLMFHYGEQDPHITAADRESVRKANPEADFHVYPAGHGFNCDVRDSYDAASAELARERTLDFFTRHLGG
jgi:carboxymethylenebutenolidase